MRAAWIVLAAGIATGCGTDDPFLIVTVTNRPAVHDVAKLRVTLTNSGTSRTDDLTASGTFPVTFSISAPGRSGDLALQIDAIDSAGQIVGRGTASSTVGETAAAVLLDSTDFVINTEFADDQYPSDDFEAHGYQLASATDGTWTVAYRDACNAPCNMFARRFDVTGLPVSTVLAAGKNGFPVSTSPTTFASTPAIATSGMATLEVWDFDDPIAATVGVACRSIDAMGRASSDQITIASDASTDVVLITPLPNNNFAVAWTAFLTTSVIRAAIVKPDCSVLVPPVTVSTTANARRASAAASGSTLMYAWIVDGSIRLRVANATNGFTGNDVELLPRTATEVIQYVRVAPIPGGFAMFVRWALSTGTMGPGRIEMYRTNLTGGILGPPTLVTTRSGSDFASSEAFGVATRSDGVLFVSWHACLEKGDGSDCGVFGRALRTDGTVVGDEFSVATTTTGIQANPSVAPLPGAFAVVWKDNSMQAPDVAGSAVRGRIVYPGVPGSTSN